MRRGPAIVLTAVASGLLSVLLAVAVNVATGGTLPGPLAGLAWLAWPMTGLFAVVTVGLAVYQQRLADHPPAGPARAAPAELPAAPAAFTGRDDDLAAAREIARQHPVVAFVGPPGVGKTSLALRFAHSRRADYPDGQLYALLRGADPEPVEPGAVLDRFLRALGPFQRSQESVDDLAAQFRSALDGRRMLILLDDARDATQVRPLLPGGTGCLVVVTSRRLLGELPGAGQHLLGALPDADARQLLAEAAPERTAGDPHGTADLVRYCAGLPLALGIVAARLRSRPAWTPTDLAGRLADEHRRLDELRLGDLAVRSAFVTSYAELPPPDRQVFRRAGTHPGRQFGAGGAAALADGAEPDVAAALERLVDAHLIESPAAGRYRLHDLLRLFAGERMDAEESAAERESALVRLLARLAAEAAPGDWIERERDNVLAAVHRGVRIGAHEPAWRLAATTGPLFRRAGDHPDLLALWSDALAAATALGDDRRRVRALCPVAYGQLQAARPAAALATAEEAVTVARRLGDPAPLAHALFVRGRVRRALFRYADAEADLTGALQRFTAAGDVEQQVEVLDTLGTMYNNEGRPAEAVALLEQALALLPEHNQHAWTRHALSAAYQAAGRTAEARALNREVLALALRTDDELAYGYALMQRGWLASDDRRTADATADMTGALAVFERISNPVGVAGAHEGIGVVAALAGRFADALSSFDTATAVFQRLAIPVEEGRIRLHRALALAELGRRAEARRERETAARLIGAAPTPELDWVRDRLTALL